MDASAALVFGANLEHCFATLAMETSKIAALLAASDAGSLSAAARRLGTQISTVSRQIRDLEAEVGATLLTRTGRGVRPTPAGERFLERGRQVLRDLDAATTEARGERAVAVSVLRLSAPLELSLRLLPPVLVALRRRHPALSVEARSDARQVSLLEEDFDAAIRLGPLRDSELVARRLGVVTLSLWARPGVARTWRAPGPFVLVTGSRTELAVSRHGRATTLRLEGALRVGTFSEAAELAARSDHAVALPSFTARAYQPRLVRVLPDVQLPATEVSLVHTQRLRGAKVVADLAELAAAELARSERAIAAP